MAHYIYFSAIPEALVVSMLPPAEFGNYLAVGTKKRSKEQAIFFELKNDFRSDSFDIESAVQQCVPHDDGTPKHSVYVSVYRTLENLPLEAFSSLWLITRDGLPLEIKQSGLPEKTQDHHLYQEFCPVHPFVASRLGPVDFCKFITDPKVRISVPKICFAEMQLDNIPKKDSTEKDWTMPYKNIPHVRDCLWELTEKDKTTKTVDRIHEQHAPFRAIESGFYIGDHENIIYYPFPTAKELDEKHHKWWRSAQLS